MLSKACGASCRGATSLMHRTPDCAANRSVSSTSCEVPEAWPRSVFSPLISCIGLTSIFVGETPMATSSPRARRPSMAADIAAGAPTDGRHHNLGSAEGLQRLGHVLPGVVDV